MSSPKYDDIEDDAKCPFLLKLFYKVGAFVRPEDFSWRNQAPHVSVYTHQTCTLADLAAHLTTLSPPHLLPSPPVGTRLVFQLVYPDIRNPDVHQQRHLFKDLGSVVIGGSPQPEDDPDPDEAARVGEEGRTLMDAKFVVGDYISCAVLPPLEDGSVAPASLARREKYVGREDGRFGGGGGGGAGGVGGFGGVPAFPSGDWRTSQRAPHAPTWPRGGRRR